MKYFFLFFSFLGLVIAFMQSWLLLAAACLTVVSFKSNAAYLIPIAIIMDGYYGAFYSFPWLSVSAVLWFLVIEYVKPRMTSG